jgi:L-fucose mutarotase
MLKGIPSVISPELMHLLMSMGHGDEMVLADGNFPAESNARRIIRADGLIAPPLLAAILQFLPLDTFGVNPVVVMQPVDENDPEPPIWSTYRSLIEQSADRQIELMPIERFAFYERAREAYGIVATSETALYANVILRKGVVMPE